MPSVKNTYEVEECVKKNHVRKAGVYAEQKKSARGLRDKKFGSLGISVLD